MRRRPHKPIERAVIDILRECSDFLCWQADTQGDHFRRYSRRDHDLHPLPIRQNGREDRHLRAHLLVAERADGLNQRHQATVGQISENLALPFRSLFIKHFARPIDDDLGHTLALEERFKWSQQFPHGRVPAERLAQGLVLPVTVWP